MGHVILWLFIVAFMRCSRVAPYFSKYVVARALKTPGKVKPHSFLKKSGGISYHEKL